MAWIVWPIFWLGYTLIRAGVSAPNFIVAHGRRAPVPYDFLDIQRHGTAYVIMSGIIVTGLLVGISWLYTKFSSRDNSLVL